MQMEPPRKNADESGDRYIKVEWTPLTTSEQTGNSYIIDYWLEVD